MVAIPITAVPVVPSVPTSKQPKSVAAITDCASILAMTEWSIAVPKQNRCV